MKKILILCLTVLCNSVSAQTVNFEWLKSLSGSNNDVIRGVCMDTSGNIYATGSFSGTTTFGNHNLVSTGATDIFIIKLNSSGNLVWSKVLGSPTLDFAFDIDCEPNGTIYVTGGFRQTINFSTSISLSSTGQMDVFTAKFDTNGNCIWAKTATGTESDYGNEIVVTNNSNVSIIGNTEGTLNIDATAYVSSSPAENDIFMAKFSPTGVLLWSKHFGNAGV
jgi:hypothetical protein